MDSNRSKTGRPMTELGRAQAAKERALAGLGLLQLRERRHEWRRIVDASLAASLAVIRHRMTAIPDRVPSLTPE
jgi:hypothetical protein